MRIAGHIYGCLSLCTTKESLILWHSLFFLTWVLDIIPNIGWWIGIQETLPEDQGEAEWCCEQPEGLASCHMIDPLVLGFLVNIVLLCGHYSS